MLTNKNAHHRNSLIEVLPCMRYERAKPTMLLAYKRSYLTRRVVSRGKVNC